MHLTECGFEQVVHMHLTVDMHLKTGVYDMYYGIPGYTWKKHKPCSQNVNAAQDKAKCYIYIEAAW